MAGEEGHGFDQPGAMLPEEASSDVLCSRPALLYGATLGIWAPASFLLAGRGCPNPSPGNTTLPGIAGGGQENAWHREDCSSMGILLITAKNMGKSGSSSQHSLIGTDCIPMALQGVNQGLCEHKRGAHRDVDGPTT